MTGRSILLAAKKGRWRYIFPIRRLLKTQLLQILLICSRRWVFVSIVFYLKGNSQTYNEYIYIAILQEKFCHSTIFNETILDSNYIIISCQKEWVCRAMHYVISQISINFIFGLFPIIAVKMLIQIDLTWLSCRTNGFSYQLTIFSLIASIYSFLVFLCLISFISRCP